MGELPNLEELAASQQAAEATEEERLEQLRAAQQKAEDEAAAKEEEERQYAQKKVDAEGPLAEREKLIAEARSVAQKIRQAKERNIEEKIASFERLDREMSDHQQALEQVGAEIEKQQDYLSKVNALIDGKGVVSDEVKAAIEQVEPEIAELKTQQQQVLSNIKTNKSLGSNREIASDYRKLLEQVQTVTDRIKTIESDPLVIEVMVREAKKENKLRNEVIEKVEERLNYNGVRLDPEGVELYHQLTEKFLDVVYNHFGAETVDQQTEVVASLLEGLNQEDIWRNEFMQRPNLEQRWQGVILSNMLNRYTYPSLNKIWQYKELGQYGERVKAEEATELVKEYFPVYNHLIAARKGVSNPAIEQRLLAYTGTDQSITMPTQGLSLHQMGFGYNRGGEPLVPEDASEEDKAVIQEKFDRVVAETQEMQQRVLDRVKNKLTSERDRLLERQERFTVMTNLQEQTEKLKRRHGHIMSDRGISHQQSVVDIVSNCETAIKMLEDGIRQQKIQLSDLEEGRKRLIGKRAKSVHQLNVEKNTVIMEGDAEELRELRDSLNEIIKRVSSLGPVDPSTKDMDEIAVRNRLAEVGRELEALEPKQR